MKFRILIFALIFSFMGNAQETISELLSQHNKKNIPYIKAEELALPNTHTYILDAREENEFKTSHLKNAQWIGFDHFSIDSVYKNIPNKTSKIVVYCSIGIRSEKIAFQLKKAGYSNVFNLHGGIFEWKNHDFPVYNSEEKETQNIHVYSKFWGKWLIKGNKVY